MSDAYNHTFQCRENPWKVKDAGKSPALAFPENSIECPCGQITKMVPPCYREAMTITCSRCGDWHSVLFEGDLGPEDFMEKYGH